MILKRLVKYNWYWMLVLNFRLLPIRQAIKLPIVICGKFRIVKLCGRIIIDADNIIPGMIKIGTQGSDMFPKNECVISLEGAIRFLGSFVIGTGSSLISKNNSVMEFGNNTILGAHNLVFCEKKIKLGEDFLSSWNCQIMDTDTHRIIDMMTCTVRESQVNVCTGEHVWIGNGVTINKGTTLPSNSIVASRSLCNKNYSEFGEYCVFAGSPAKLVSKNKKWEL